MQHDLKCTCKLGRALNRLYHEYINAYVKAPTYVRVKAATYVYVKAPTYVRVKASTYVKKARHHAGLCTEDECCCKRRHVLYECTGAIHVCMYACLGGYVCVCVCEYMLMHACLNTCICIQCLHNAYSRVPSLAKHTHVHIAMHICAHPHGCVQHCDSYVH